jgi:deferrochelatase/peroxidase EfeB
MTDLQTLLDKPISWRKWTTDSDLLSLLSDLQANILKGHGRDHTQNIFLSFAEMSSADVAGLLSDLSFVTTSALEQLREAAAFSAARVSGGTVVCVMLSIGGYKKLGIPGANIPGDHAFREGMIKRGRLDPMTFTTINGVPFPSINDPEKANWEKGGAWDPGKAEPDALVLVADDNASLVGNSVSALKKVFAKHKAKVTGIDTGLAQRRKQKGGNEKGEGIEHFGYVDGASQPLFLAEDLPAQPGAWDETFKPSRFIVPDPGNPTTFSCGSYFVYRKLEQNVKKFKEQEEELAHVLGLTGQMKSEQALSLLDVSRMVRP